MSKSDKKKVLLFVCSGNTCRSQMFAIIAQMVLGDDYICKSAGTSVISSYTEENGKKAVDKLFGIDCPYPKTTTELSQKLIDEADAVFCLGENVSYSALTQFDHVAEKLMMDNILDPYDLQYFPQEIVTKLMRLKAMDFEELRRDKCQEAYDFAAIFMKEYAEDGLKEKVDTIIASQTPNPNKATASSGYSLGQKPQYKSKL